MRTLFLALAVACSSTTSVDKDAETDGVAETDATDTVETGVVACGVDTSVDEYATRVDPRLKRWPYYSNASSTGVTVQWGLDAGTEGGLEWGTDDAFGTAAKATLAPIDRLVDPIQLHSVRLDDLTPDTQYCYRLTLGEDDLTGPLAFKTAPASDTDRTVRFLVMGDYGVGIGFPVLVFEQISEHYGEIEFWLSTGDNAYTNGTDDQWQINHFVFYQDLLRRAPYYPSAGNHDYSGPFGLQPMLDSIDLPKQAYQDADNGRYYAFDWGPVHFSVTDSELAIDQITEDVEDDDMIDWLEDDLAAAQDRPWRFGVWHHPRYLTEPGRSPKGNVVKYLAPAMEAGNVQVALSGHSHNYEAFLNMKDGAKVEGGGTSYITTGGGGAPPDAIDGEDKADIIALRDFGQAVNHFMLFEVDRCSVKARAIDRDGTEIHVWTLERDCE